VITEEGALKDTLLCTRYLKQHGLEPERIFRAAWFQNVATPALANEVMDGSASYTNTSGVTPFPFPDRYNIPRYAMHGDPLKRNETTIVNLFTALKNQHCTIFLYTHGVSNRENDLTTDLFAYYLREITNGVDEGWLNVTTYNRMMNHYRRIK
jgi:hypothetical protein